jgi:hypothetical protein
VRQSYSINKETHQKRTILMAASAIYALFVPRAAMDLIVKKKKEGTHTMQLQQRAIAVSGSMLRDPGRVKIATPGRSLGICGMGKETASA